MEHHPKGLEHVSKNPGLVTSTCKASEPTEQGMTRWYLLLSNDDKVG